MHNGKPTCRIYVKNARLRLNSDIVATPAQQRTIVLYTETKEWKIVHLVYFFFSVFETVSVVI